MMAWIKTTSILLAMFAIYGRMNSAATHPSKELIRIPKARYLFGISTAPSGYALLLYRSSEAPEGEVTSGAAVLVKLKAPLEFLPLTVPSATEDLAPAVWKKKGQMAYILTSAGIYSVNPRTGMSNLIVRGMLAGLAISPDGTRLAFWNLGSMGTQYTLSVFDIHSGRNVRTWKVPTKFDADQYGHEIVFSGDGSAVLARTYDQEDRTPLEQFDIRSGQVQMIWPNCSGLARSSEAIYFIGSDHRENTLLKLVPSAFTPQKVMAPFPFNSLISSSTQKWVIAVDDRNHTMEALDSETDHLLSVPSWCENAGVLRNGQVVCSRGGDLILGVSLSSGKAH